MGVQITGAGGSEGWRIRCLYRRLAVAGASFFGQDLGAGAQGFRGRVPGVRSLTSEQLVGLGAALPRRYPGWPDFPQP